MIGRPLVILYYLPYCSACKEFERRVIEPLYKNNDIDLIKVDVDIEPEVKLIKDVDLTAEIPPVGYKYHYDWACRRSPTGCVVPAVEILPPYPKKHEYVSTFIFTDGNENEFEKLVIKEIEKYTLRTANLVKA